jgi:hypothetical protein
MCNITETSPAASALTPLTPPPPLTPLLFFSVFASETVEPILTIAKSIASASRLHRNKKQLFA